MENDNLEPQDMFEEVDPHAGSVPPTEEPERPMSMPNPPANLTVHPPTQEEHVQSSEELAQQTEPMPQVSKGAGGSGWLPVALIILVLAGAAYFASQNWNKWFGGDQQANNQEQPVTSDISWRPQPVRAADLHVAVPYEGQPTTDIKYWRVGTFTDGKYKGGELIILTTPPNGPSIGDAFYHFVSTATGDLVLLSKESDDLYDGDGLDRTAFTIDDTYTVADLNFPANIDNPKNSEQKLALDEFSTHLWFADKTQLKEVFTDPKYGPVYTDTTTQTIPITTDYRPGGVGQGGFYLKAPDGTLRSYKLVVPFLPQTNVPNIIWSDNKKNVQEYIVTDFGGCGSYNYASVMPAALASDITQTGTVKYGDTEEAVMELKDKNHTLLKNTFQQYSAFGGGKDAMGNDLLTYDQFVASHPIFFWTDSFGRLLKFQSNKFMPAAECGKPVIYLYPVQPGKVHVEVQPQGGMTYSDPAYGTGWDVLADPSGAVKNLADGKTYPYLFWEGRGGIYQAPDKGWVVPQAKVDATITDKLTQYGLNGSEIADFKEFWLPRMQTAPYYFISFLGTSEMNKLAPLNITPKPDTILRVLMDFKPLAKPVAVSGYQIHPITRHGFTVIEWGGVIQ